MSLLIACISVQGYQVEELLGKGGFGIVHRAKSLHKASFGEEVAIKMVRALFK
jgi:hypothetical protein